MVERLRDELRRRFVVDVRFVDDADFLVLLDDDVTCLVRARRCTPDDDCVSSREDADVSET